MENAAGSGETLEQASVTDEMLVVLSHVINEHPKCKRLPINIGALERVITGTIREQSGEAVDRPVFKSVDLPKVESASSMAIHKALANLTEDRVIEGERGNLEIVSVRLMDYAKESSVYLNEEQHEALASFSTRLGKNLESVLLELQEA